jgi:hypothetical protein
MRASRWILPAVLLGLVFAPGHPRAQQPGAAFHGIGDLAGGGVGSAVRDATRVDGVTYAVGSSTTVNDPAPPNLPQLDTPALWTRANSCPPPPAPSSPDPCSVLTALPPGSGFDGTNGTSGQALSAYAITPFASYIASQARFPNSGAGTRWVRVERSLLTAPDPTTANLDISDMAGLPVAFAAIAISDNNEVVYGQGTNEDGTRTPRRYEAGRGINVVDITPTGKTWGVPIPRGTSEDGRVMVGFASDGSAIVTTTPGGPTGGVFGTNAVAFRYEHDAGLLTGTTSLIPMLPDGGTWNMPVAISATGDHTVVIGDSASYPNGEVYLTGASNTLTARLGSPNTAWMPRVLGGMTADGSVIAVTFAGTPNFGPGQISGLGIPTGNRFAYIHNDHGWFQLSTILAAHGIDLVERGWDPTNMAITGIRTVDGVDLVFGQGRRRTVGPTGYVAGALEGFVAELPQGVLADFDPEPTPPEDQSLVGVWVVGDPATSANAVAFMADGTFYRVSPVGFERGLYTWAGNGAGGAFTQITRQDTDGNLGASFRDGQRGLSFMVAGDVATLHDAHCTGCTFASLNRVMHSPGSIAGGWGFGDAAQPDASAVLILLGGAAGNRYFLGQDFEGVENDGSEQGTYEWDSLTGELTFIPANGPPDPGDIATLSRDSLGLHVLDGKDHSEYNGTRIVDPALVQPAFTNTLVAAGTVGVAFSFPPTAIYTATFEATGLPDGLAIENVTGEISGTPTTPGSHPVLLTAHNSFGLSTNAVLTITITDQQEPLFVTGAPATAALGESFTVGTTGGSGTGAVTFATLGSCTNTAGGAVITMTAGVESCFVTATKAGDEVYGETTSEPAEVIGVGGGRLVEWIVDASGAWEHTANWSGGMVPAAGDWVVINRPAGAFTVTISSATAAISRLDASEALVVNGTLTLDGEGIADGGLTLSGALAGTGSVVLGADAAWISGTISLGGGVTVAHGHVLTIGSIDATHVLTATTLRNHGTVTWTAGAISLTGGGTVSVVNEAGGLWDAAGDLTFTSNGGGNLTFANAGTLRKSAGAGTLLLGGAVAYSNTGTLHIQTGTLRFSGDGASATLMNSGELHVAAEATALLDRVTLAAGSTFTGGGLLQMNGTTTVTGDVTVTLPSLLANSTVTGPGRLRLSAPMQWAGGIMALGEGLDVNPGQTLTFGPGGAGHVLTMTSLRNHGTVTWTAGAISLTGGGTVSVVNEADGLWDAAGDLTFTSNGGGNLTFANAGTLRKSAGAGTLLLGGHVAYSNTGTLAIHTGTLRFSGDGAGATLLNSGELHVAAEATVLLDRVTLAAGSTFTGGGLLQMNGITTVTGDVTVTLPSVLANSTITGPGRLRLSAPMQWEGGVLTLGEGLDVNPGQTLTFGPGGAGHVLTMTSLRNHGTVTWTAGAISLTGGGTVSVVNEADGLWDAAGDLTFTSNGGGNLTFANAGTLRKSAGAGTLLLGGHVAYSNTGTLAIHTGTLRFSGDGAGATLLNSGELHVAAEATVLLDRVTLAAGSTFTGGGLLQMNGITTVTGDVTVTLPSVLANSTITGPGRLRLSAPMQWEGGVLTLGEGLDVNPGQTLTFGPGGAGHVLTMTSLRNHGTVIWNGGTISLTGGGTAVVEVTNFGIWEIAGSQVLTSNGAGQSLSFTNAGTLRRAGSLGTLTVTDWVHFVNTGTLGFRLASATDFDRISIIRGALGGTVHAAGVDGFVPPNGSSYRIMQVMRASASPMTTGIFSDTAGDGFAFSLCYVPDSDLDPHTEGVLICNTFVESQPQSIDVTVPAPASAVFATSFDVAATASSGLPVSITVSGVCVLTSGGSGSATVQMTNGTGLCTVHYNQPGGATYSAAPEVTSDTIALRAAQSSLVVIGAPETAVYGASFTVNTTGGSGSGGVTFSTSGVCANLGSLITMTSGTGVCSILATKAGDGNYEEATATAAVVAMLATQPPLTIVGAPASAPLDSVFTISVSGGAGTGVVTFSADGACSNSGPSIMMTSDTGVCTIGAVKAADADFAAGTAEPVTVDAVSPPPLPLFETLRTFAADGTEGFHPAGPMVQGADGWIYGLTIHTGTPGISIGACPSGFRFDPADPVGTFEIVWTPVGCPNGPPHGPGPLSVGAGGLVRGSDDLIYFTSANNGYDPDCGGRIFQWRPPADVRVVFCSRVLANLSHGLSAGSDGALYGAAVHDGGSFSGGIYKLTPDGTDHPVVTVVAPFPADLALAPQGSQLTPPILASDGWLYGTATVWLNAAESVPHRNVVYRADPLTGTIELLHDFPASDGSISWPDGAGLMGRLLEMPPLPGHDVAVLGTTRQNGSYAAVACSGSTWQAARPPSARSTNSMSGQVRI